MGMDLAFAEVQTFVSNLVKAKDFYQRVLGLRLVDETQKWLIFDISGTILIIMAGARPRTSAGSYGSESGTVVCFLSADIDRDYAELTSQGVRFFSEITEVPEGRFVGFQDPDGNLLELIQK
ncbi:MAG: VOC family protein [candidate division Zixibacteria bacterium]|nr:VOC family protein [candidate division Zixibacteria bacterium]